MGNFAKISQSLMKAYVDYVNKKECGVFFKARYIDKDPDCENIIPSDAMKLGMYFEYMATGSLPRNGVVPEAEYVYKGTPKERIGVAYERANQSAQLFKRIIKHYDINIQDVGVVLATDIAKGIIDIFAEWGGRAVFIDLKYSGLIDDKWNESGWDLESLPQKDSLMVQGVQYKILAEDCLGVVDIPFYYFVFSSADPNNVKIILQNVDESRIASHRLAINNLLEKLETEKFTPFPTMKRCGECPLAYKCEFATTVPLIDRVDY